ncbi:MAG TPA: histidine phosphatase family protein, partial [Candidatus Thermoplasmatota archaeon]|nr:histidine phosphatase family protein [Candidatus Thermoplasmatota archaeon]
RHGETTSNRDQVIQGPRIDASLSELGRRQAHAVAEALAGERLDALYTSPMARARETAQALAEHRAASRLAVQVVPELYEMDYGLFAGRTYDDVRDEMDQVLDAWRLGFVDQSFPGGESAILAQHRVRPFALRLRTQAESETLAVVAHGRINRVLAATLTGAGLQRLEEFPQSNAAITELEVASGRVRLVRLNDTRHLDEANEAFS